MARPECLRFVYNKYNRSLLFQTDLPFFPFLPTKSNQLHSTDGPKIEWTNRKLLVGFTLQLEKLGQDQAAVSRVHACRREPPRPELGHPHGVGAVVEQEQVAAARGRVLGVHSSRDDGPPTGTETLHHRVVNLLQIYSFFLKKEEDGVLCEIAEHLICRPWQKH